MTQCASTMTTANKRPKFMRSNSSFLRVADLDMDDKTSSSDEDEAYPNFHHPAVDPPPGVAHDPKKKWIVLNDGDGLHAPIAPAALERLADFGLTTSMNQNMWKPHGKTEKLFNTGKVIKWMKQTFQPGCVQLMEQGSQEAEVLIWGKL